MDHVIFAQFDGTMVQIDEPKGNPERPNFVITWNGKDWSGFRTLAECKKQFPELEKNKKDPYQVIER